MLASPPPSLIPPVPLSLSQLFSFLVHLNRVLEEVVLSLEAREERKDHGHAMHLGCNGQKQEMESAIKSS